MSRLSLPADDIVLHDRIPVTHPVRTLLDLATELNIKALERAINDADKRDLVDPETLRTELDRYAGEPGVRRLRALLDKHTFLLSDSDLELLFRPIAAAAGLSLPLTKVWVNGYEVDFYWPDLELVVETDGLRYHRTASTQTKDHVRDQAHVASGLATLRFTHHQVKYESAHVLRVLRQTAQRLHERREKRR